ncbi:hypothetical protein VP01_9208g1, partial [Puccinia sorghi]
CVVQDSEEYTIQGQNKTQEQHVSFMMPMPLVSVNFNTFNKLPRCYCNGCEGMYNKSVFLTSYPVINSVLVIENARIHKGGKITRLCQDAGIRLIYLPPPGPINKHLMTGEMRLLN